MDKEQARALLYILESLKNDQKHYLKKMNKNFTFWSIVIALVLIFNVVYFGLIFFLL